MKILVNYESYNQRRYSAPWIAKVNEKAKISFGEKIGSYTGNHAHGESGQLYFYDAPVENQVYAYGQKDYRGNNSIKKYCIYKNGQFLEVPSQRLLEALTSPNTYSAEIVGEYM